MNKRLDLNFTYGNIWLGSELFGGWWTLHAILSIKYLQHFSWYFFEWIAQNSSRNTYRMWQEAFVTSWPLLQLKHPVYSSSNSWSLHLLLIGNVCDQKIHTIEYIWAGGGGWHGTGCLNLFIKWLCPGVAVIFFQLCYHSGLLHNSCIWQCSQIWWLVQAMLRSEELVLTC